MSAVPANVLPFYLARRILGPFAVLTAVLLFALTLERVLRLVQMVTELGAPIHAVGELLSYLLPHYLGQAIPAAWFLGVLIGLRGLQQGAELTVMHASGLPLWRLFLPLLAISLGLLLVMVGLTGYLQPVTRYAYNVRLQELKRKDFWSKLQPGVFTMIEGGRGVIHVGRVGEGGRVMGEFFASYQSAPDRSRVYLSAQRAEIKSAVAAGTDSDTQLVLLDGMMVSRDRRKPELRRVLVSSFEEFPWSLSLAGLLPAYGLRGQSEREMTLGELRADNAPATPLNDSPARRLTEWHYRLVMCVSVPLLGILAAPLALLGRGRSSRPYGFAIGIPLLVLYQKILGTGQAFGKMGVLPPGPAVWGVCAVLAVLAFMLFHWWGGDRNASAPRGGKAVQSA